MYLWGTGTFFICFVGGFLIAMALVGWQAVISLALFIVGYLWVLSTVNALYHPDGRRKRRRRR